MRHLIPLVLVAACAARPTPHVGAVGASPPTTDTGDTASTGSTETSPAHTADGALQPDIVVTGSFRGYRGWVAVGAYRDDPGFVLLLADGAGRSAPYSFVPGRLAPGTYTWTDLGGHDAIAWPGVELGPPLAAGDVDGDGHQDLWFGRTLARGPFDQLAPGHSTVAVAPGWVWSTGFDADRDGVPDVLAWNGNYDLEILYGPLEGDLSSPEVPVTRFGGNDTEFRARLPDHFGPGHDGLGIQLDPYMGTGDGLYDLWQPRGATPEPVAGFSPSWVDAFADLDGDADQDLVWRCGTASAPMLDDAEPPVTTWDCDPSSSAPAEAVASLSDLNGDGRDELVFRLILGEVGGVWQLGDLAVAFSPHAAVLDPTLGLRLAAADDEHTSYPSVSVDLDGDGLAELVEVSSSDPYAYDTLRIWRGATLRALAP